LLGDISETADSISDFAKLLPESASGDTLLSTAGEILNIFSEDAAVNTEVVEEMQSNGQVENGTLEVPLNGLESDISEQAVTNQIVSEQTASDQLVSEQTVSNQIVSEQTVPNQLVSEQIIPGRTALEQDTSGNTVPKQNVLKQESLETPTFETKLADNGNADQIIKTDLSAEHKEENVVVQSENRLLDSGLEKKFGVDKEVLSNLENQMRNAGFSSEETRNMFESAKTPVDLLKQITQGLQTNGADTVAVRAVISSDEFKKMLSDVVKNSWTMDPKSMKDPKEIDELYDRITKQSKAFENTIASKGGDAQHFNQNSQNMRQNMNFMEQLNNQMIYAQLPLKLSSQNANSELYVYADKRKLLEKKDGISVMLHLDMDHLGTTDIKVTLTGSNVNARFYLNDQQSVDIVAGNMEELADQLRERGFTLTDEVVKRQPQTSINQVVDEIIDENAEKSIKRYTFDVKM
jgi:hypothetical protein